MTINRKTGLLALITGLIGVVLTFFLPIKLDEDGLRFIKRWESFAACPYQDLAGVWTIGYGMTHYHDGNQVSEWDPCLTEAEADYYLRRIVREYEYAVHDAVDVSLTQPMYNALVSFCYNVGVNAWYRSGLLRRVNNDPTDPLIVKEFYKWIYIKGKPSRGLRNRREAEIEMYYSMPYLFKEQEKVQVYARPDTIMIP